MTKPWTPTAGDFTAFIDWLDGGIDSGGRSYIEMHSRLVAYFARKGCDTPDTLADETLSRVARRLQEEGTITNVVPAQYCYIVARFVLLEYLRGGDRHHVPLLHEVRDRSLADESERRERLLARLDECLAQLTHDERELIVAYYSGEGSSRSGARNRLAAMLGLTPNALTIRASRLRERIRACFSTQQDS